LASLGSATEVQEARNLLPPDGHGAFELGPPIKSAQA
jgi:hypothetical protein